MPEKDTIKKSSKCCGFDGFFIYATTRYRKYRMRKVSFVLRDAIACFTKKRELNYYGFLRNGTEGYFCIERNDLHYNSEVI